MMKRDFEAHGGAVNEGVPLAAITGDSNYLEQTRQILADLKPGLTGEKA